MDYFNATSYAKFAEDKTGRYRSPSQFLYLSSTRNLLTKISDDLGLPREKLFYRERGSDRSKWGMYFHKSLKVEFIKWVDYAGVEPREAQIRAEYLANSSNATEAREGILTKGNFIKISNAKNWAKAIGEVLVFSQIYNCDPLIHFYGYCPRLLLEHIKSKCNQLKISVTWEDGMSKIILNS